MKQLQRFSLLTLISIIVGVLMMLTYDFVIGYFFIAVGVILAFIFNLPE